MCPGAPRAWPGAVLGLVVGAVAVGVAHLVAGLANPDVSPVLAIGEATIELHFRLVSGIRDAFRG